MTVRKHFIAGARCPHCQAEDRVRHCRDGTREWLECVACGQVSEDPGAPAHPPQAAPEAEPDVVRLRPRP